MGSATDALQSPLARRVEALGRDYAEQDRAWLVREAAVILRTRAEAREHLLDAAALLVIAAERGEK